MAVVKSVNVGESITASWANALVTEANNHPVQSGSFYDASGKTGKGYLLTSSGAWHIATSNHGTVTLNAGQIYVNNMLVKPENWSGSYNQRCSCGNFKDFAVTKCLKDTLPTFYIIVKGPKIVTEKNINKVTATLYKSSGDTPEPPEAPTVSEEERYVIIQLNEIKDKQIKQLISGTIYLNFDSTGAPSIIAGDGIHIDYQQDATIISSKISVVSTDEIIIPNQYTDMNGMIMVELSANLPAPPKQVSLIAGDGIIIEPEEEEEENRIVYKISISNINIDFDPEWFTVTDGTVTLNEEKLESEANELAKTISSEIQTTASAAIDTVNDCGREGDIMLKIDTVGESATATAWTD